MENETFPKVTTMEVCKLNTLQIDIEGDNSAIEHILSKLFDTAGEDVTKSADYRYNKVDEELVGLEVNVKVSEKPRHGDLKPHAVILALDVAAKEPIDIKERLQRLSGTNTLVLIINNISQKQLLKAGSLQEEYKDLPSANQINDIKKNDYDFEKHFVKFIETNDEHLQATFDTLINLALVLSSESDLIQFDKNKKALFQKYDHHWASLSQKNILHLLAKRNLGLAINKLADDISADDMFKLLSDQDKNKNTPLVTAALSSNGVALAAMLNFYSSNIIMSEIHQPENLKNKEIIDEMLHTSDLMNHNLTYHIVQTSRKCLGPYGTILQMEKDFHVKPEAIKTLIEKDDYTEKNESEEEVEQEEVKQKQEEQGKVDDFLKLELCLQKNQGSTMETSLVMKLLSSTREASKGVLWARIILFVFLVSFFQLSLHMGDVVSDVLLGAHYFGEWINGVTEHVETHEKITLQSYPSQLHASHKVMYYLIFILAPCLLYTVEILREIHCGTSCMKTAEQSKTKLKLISDRVIVVLFPLSVVMWPVIINIKKAYLLFKYHTTKGHEQLMWKAASKEMARKAGMVHLSEVCIESTFVSILNWYILLPNFLTELDISFDNADNSLTLSSVSFLISIVSLAWSYTSYIAEEKEGALALTWDPASRLVLFISNLLLIFARMNCIVLFMFYFGPGQIYPGMFFLLGHIILMMAIHAYNVLRYTTVQDKDQPQSNIICFAGRLFHVSLMNGLANVFINNFVHVSLNNQKSLGRKKKKSFYRQTIGDIIFLVENIICVVFGCSTNVAPINSPLTMTYLVSTIFACHIVGLLLKIFYYKFMHIWKNLTPTFDFKKKSFRRAEESIHLYKKNKTTM
eukprot:GFUD01000314.1.p1 GENE.GFUD01000314.1~~GFUD01000314.1.p1  ORF type:complete len:859 (-),score=190.48 GFUD01000314.1:80-2656(-)